MKKCTQCKIEKKDFEFEQKFDRKDSNRLSSKCRDCRSIRRSERRCLNKIVWLEYLPGFKCERCGYNKCSQALEFHHLDSNEKLYSVSVLLGTHNPHYSKPKYIKRVLDEIEKCAILCANCHRELHYSE